MVSVTERERPAPEGGAESPSPTGGARFAFCLASPDDGDEILEILEGEEFKGSISLLYTRRPDAFKSLLLEGDEVLITVCRDLQEGRIAGFGACAIREQFIDGKPERVGYLFGLRGRKEYQRVFHLLPKGYAFLRSCLEKKGVRFFYTSILEDNDYALSLFAKRRAYMPTYENLGTYTVYMMKTNMGRPHSPLDPGGVFAVGPNGAWRFESVGPDGFQEVTDFLNREGSRRQLFPVVRPGQSRGPAIDSYRVIRNAEGQVIAAGAAWDQRPYKQYVMQGFGGYMKWVGRLSFLLPILGYPPVPKTGSVVNFFTLSYWAVKDDDPQTFRALLEGFSRTGGDYSCFVIGLHETDPLNRVAEAIRHISYRSRIKAVGWDSESPEASASEVSVATVKPLPRQKGEVLHLECGEL